MKWKIGDVEIDNQVILAPMSGLCTPSFRHIIKSMGCGLIGTQMISTEAIKYGGGRTDELLYMTDYERPISIQLFGSDPNSFRIGAEYVYDHVKPDIIDINMGCPVKKVAIRSKSGSALLKNPKKVHDIVKAVVDTVDIPVTVKIRSGWDENSINAVEIGRIVENAGASAIAVHPRTRDQGYSGKADWSIIKDVKEELSIPVIGNGDVKSCYDAKRMIDETKCDAVMIGRGVLGNPWLIKECINYLDEGIEPEKISIEEKISVIKRHVELFLNDNDEDIAMRRMRNPVSNYLKYFPKNHDILEKLFKINTKDELFKLLDDYYTDLNHD
ncbi:MAG: tRNA dihydrouridine synthase DusB [Methanobrevibacter sp.]|uniref:tRNA dihydrouridine synthase DusB n=1 Tax=Methanobrevibacter sp. TaxID=66852 RepID=UPI0026E10872|nr:tRNA dihydrouridine synthase DusB [Methanobrevibacter sp.]MDO5849497.1 tRNA dihydrouridine synthase DusB [Methanobrevibacter sp.]